MAEACEIPRQNATPDEIREILSQVKTIAVVGLSDNADRDSHRVARYLQTAGYRIIPVNPAISEVLTEKAYDSLADIPDKVDLVNIFRRPDAVPAIVEEAIKIKAMAIWMQLGIVHNEAADSAREAGLKVVMSRCVMVDHRSMMS